MGFKANESAISPELMRELLVADEGEMHAYLVGASRDGTVNRKHRTLRIAQSDPRWLQVLGVLLDRLGHKSWGYREGRRKVWVLETCYRISKTRLRSRAERVAFVRGYFDAEGGIPRKAHDRFYIQIVQKDRPDLQYVAEALESLGIRCGRLHNPSRRVDPKYWRFFIRSSSHADFVRIVGSWHPRKHELLRSRGHPKEFKLAGPSGGLARNGRIETISAQRSG